MERLHRRGGKFKKLPAGMVSEILTPKKEKFRNYRPVKSRKGLMRAIYEENKANDVLVVNKGRKWGQMI